MIRLEALLSSIEVLFKFGVFQIRGSLLLSSIDSIASVKLQLIDHSYWFQGFFNLGLDLRLLQWIWGLFSGFELPLAGIYYLTFVVHAYFYTCAYCYIWIHVFFLRNMDTCILVCILLYYLYTFDLGLLCVFIKMVCLHLLSYYSTLSVYWVFSYYETLCAFWGHKFSYSVVNKPSFFGNKGLRVQASGLWAAY